MVMLILGKNNVFNEGNANYDFVGHDEVSGIDFAKHSKVVITAFDPQKKQKAIKRPPIYATSHFLKEIQEKSVYYISTARANDLPEDIIGSKYEKYVQNKIYEENFFLRECNRVQIVRVSNIISELNKSYSIFQKSLCYGISQSAVHFDTTSYSTWNFLFATSVLQWIENQVPKSSASQAVTLMSQTDTSANDISRFISHALSIETTFGSNVTRYTRPTKNLILINEDQHKILGTLTSA